MLDDDDDDGVEADAEYMPAKGLEMDGSATENDDREPGKAACTMRRPDDIVSRFDTLGHSQGTFYEVNTNE